MIVNFIKIVILIHVLDALIATNDNETHDGTVLPSAWTYYYSS